MLSTGPIRAALDRGIIDCVHWTIVYQASDLPLNFRLYLSRLSGAPRLADVGRTTAQEAT
jgi:hypothetical protein